MKVTDMEYQVTHVLPMTAFSFGLSDGCYLDRPGQQNKTMYISKYTCIYSYICM